MLRSLLSWSTPLISRFSYNHDKKLVCFSFETLLIAKNSIKYHDLGQLVKMGLGHFFSLLGLNDAIQDVIFLLAGAFYPPHLRVWWWIHELWSLLWKQKRVQASQKNPLWYVENHVLQAKRSSLSWVMQFILFYYLHFMITKYLRF